ncbi:hypothetical protein ACEQPO_08250 [Bacillus sp. SL00103]
MTGSFNKFIPKLSPHDQLTPTRVLAQEPMYQDQLYSLLMMNCWQEDMSAHLEEAVRGSFEDHNAASAPHQGEPPFPLPVRPHFQEAEKQMDHWLSANQFHEKLDIDFRHQEPAIDEHFQTYGNARLMKALQQLEMKDWGYSSPHGLWEVRSEIRQYLSVERGIDVEEDQIVLTGGTQRSH